MRGMMASTIRRLTAMSLVVMVAALALVHTGAAGGSDWEYVPPAESDGPAPIFNAAFLSDVKPADLAEDVDYRGVRRQYAQWRYGSPDSVRVAVAVDRHESGEADLYVDANRNRIVEQRERLEGPSPAYRLPLDVAIVGEETVVESYPRQVVLKLGSTGRTLLWATLGCMQGTVEIDPDARSVRVERHVTARRVDGDGNGLFADPDDRLWLDLDDDGEWNTFTEQWLFAPVLRVGNDRLLARSDVLGHRLTLAPLTDTGRIQLTLPESIKPEALADISATLIGDDGSIVSVSGLDRPAEVPAGKYRMNVLSLTLDAGTGQPTWSYLFATSREREAPWHDVPKDETLTLNAVGRLEFMLERPDGKTGCRAGDELSMQARLYTAENLLIVTSYRGSDDSEEHQPKCIVSVCSADGEPLESHTCGFV